MPTHNFEICVAGGSLVNVETYTTVPNMAPRSAFYPFGETVAAVDGSRITRGAAYATWTWGFIPTAQFNSLRTICTGGSVAVDIRTLQQDYSTYAYYHAVMVWPDAESYEHNAKGFSTFELRFERLVAY